MATEIGDDLVAINDFETGGLDEKTADIIAYGTRIIHPQTLEVVRSDTFKVRPIFAVAEQAAAVNGYTEEDWVDALSQEEGVIRYRDFLGPVFQFGSWNAWFDRRFLAETTRRTGIAVRLDYHNVDIVPMFREKMWMLDRKLEKFSLDEAAKALGLEPEAKPHLPLGGVDKALEVWAALRKL